MWRPSANSWAETLRGSTRSGSPSGIYGSVRIAAGNGLKPVLAPAPEEIEEAAGKINAAKFLRHLIKACPYKIHTIPTDNGVQFTERKANSMAREHIFDRICRENGIEHRLTKVNHPWTNGQVERMNRTLKEASVKRYHYS